MSSIYHWLGFIVFWLALLVGTVYSGGLLWQRIGEHKRRIWLYQFVEIIRFYKRLRATGRLITEREDLRFSERWQLRSVVRKLQADNNRVWSPWRPVWRIWFGWELMILDTELAGLEWNKWSMGVNYIGTDISPDW